MSYSSGLWNCWFSACPVISEKTDVPKPDRFSYAPRDPRSCFSAISPFVDFYLMDHHGYLSFIIASYLYSSGLEGGSNKKGNISYS